MKIKIVFTPQALKNINNLLELIYKLIQSENTLPKVYFNYFIKSKNIRFLIDSEKTPIIISLGSQMINYNETTCHFKEGKEIVTMQFESSQMFFTNLIGILEKEDSSGLVFQVRKQILDKSQKKFAKLTLRDNPNFLSRIPVDTPKYDIQEMKYHNWICGCPENDILLQCVIFTDELLNIMRYLVKIKHGCDQKMSIKLHLPSKTYKARSTDEHCLPNVVGEFKVVKSQLQESVTQVEYRIKTVDMKMVYEMINKVKQLKIIISKSYEFIIVFMKDQLFVCHINMSNWIYNNGTMNTNSGVVTKIQEMDRES